MVPGGGYCPAPRPEPVGLDCRTPIPKIPTLPAREPPGVRAGPWHRPRLSHGLRQGSRWQSRAAAGRTGAGARRSATEQGRATGEEAVRSAANPPKEKQPRPQEQGAPPLRTELPRKGGGRLARGRGDSGQGPRQGGHSLRHPWASASSSVLLWALTGWHSGTRAPIIAVVHVCTRCPSPEGRKPSSPRQQPLGSKGTVDTQLFLLGTTLGCTVRGPPQHP